MSAHIQKNKKTHRELQKEETRRIILESAYRLFAELGYAKTTMRDLATDSGVGLGTVFKHFPDKSSLLVAAFEEDIQSVIEQGINSLPGEDIFIQLRHLLHSLYSFYAKNQLLSRALVKEALFIEGPAGETIQAQAMNFLEGVGNLLQGGVTRGEIQPIENHLDAVRGFWSFYLMGLTMGLREPQFDVEQQVEMVGKLLQNHFPKVKK